MSGGVHDLAAFRAGLDADPRQGSMLPRAPAIWVEDGDWSEAEIPPRRWIVPGYLLRGSVTVLSGPGSAGKSMLTVLWVLALALGRRVGRFAASAQFRSLVYNVEDDADEQRRRISAALRQFEVVPGDLGGRVVRVGPHGPGQLYQSDMATRRLSGSAVLRDLEAEMVRARPDVVFLDPFVELHDAEENDNTAVRMVMAQLRLLAVQYDCAICVLHHARKGAAGAAGDMDTLRGASAIAAAARVVLTLLTMDKAEARELGIPEEQRTRYFRLDGAKSNYAPLQDAEWYERHAHQLDNGDWVAAAEPWTPPQPMREIDPAALNRALDRIAVGPAPGVLYAASQRGGSDRWAGSAIMVEAECGEDQARQLVAAWVRNGLLVVTTFRHPQARRDMQGVRVNDAKRPTV